MHPDFSKASFQGNILSEWNKKESCHFLSALLQHALQEVPLKSVRFHQVQNVAVWAVMSMCRRAHRAPLFHELHWLPICFQVQFKVLVGTFKALRGLGMDYVKDCLSPVVSTCSVGSGRSGTLWVSSAGESYLLRAGT